MYEVEEGLEGFVEQVGKVVLDLLSPLNADEGVSYIRQAVHFFFIYFILGSRLFYLQTHISTNPTKVAVFLKMVVHCEDGVSSCFESNIYKDDILGM